MSDQISKSSKAEQIKGSGKLSAKEVRHPVSVASPSDSPSSSHLSDNGFQGFDSFSLSEKQSEKHNILHRLLDELNDSKEAGTSHKSSVEEEDDKIVKEDIELEAEAEEEADEVTEEPDMTVDNEHASDSDSEQMEIDIISNDKDNLSKADSTEFSDKQDKGDRTKDSDVEIMETDSVKSGGGKMSRKRQKGNSIKTEGPDGNAATSSILESTLKGSNIKVEYCGGCESEVDDAEEGICCDGKCERWFHLRCSGLTQAEYDELGRDENAKWACNQCSGKPPPIIKADAKPLLTVRKDLAATIVTPSPAKRKPILKDGSARTPKIDISNPAFLKPFDFGWKRELVYRSTSDNQNRRQGDVYYYTPKGKKLRSLRELTDHLTGSPDLTADNFTFWKEPLGLDDPEKEIIRDAKLKSVNKDPTASPSEPKKAVTPKVPKTPKVTPKLTATVTPLDSSSGVTLSTPKASASVTPRVVLKGKSSIGTTGPKFKVTPSKNTVPGQTQKIVISKDAAKMPPKENTCNNESQHVLNYQSIITDSRASTAVNQEETLEGIEMSTRNKFRRYGLLANAKTPKKKATKSGFPSSFSSDESREAAPVGAVGTKGLAALPEDILNLNNIGSDKSQLTQPSATVKSNPGGPSKVISVDTYLNDKMAYSKKHGHSSSLFHSLYKGFNEKLPLPSTPDRSSFQSPNRRRQSPPELQFRPSNPSSYGCQTSPMISRRPLHQNSVGPSSSPFYHSNLITPTSPFETVLIVDTTTSTETYMSSPKRKDPSYETPLILNSSDCSIEIINVESLSTDQMSNFEGYVVHSPKNRSQSNVHKRVSDMNGHGSRRNESRFRMEAEHSPISLQSSTTDEIVEVEEDPECSSSPPTLMRNSPPPKPHATTSATYRSRSPPSLQPILPPPPLVPCPARLNSRSFLPSSQNCKQMMEMPHCSNMVRHNVVEEKQKGSAHADYRKLKRERFYMRLKAKSEMEKLKKSYIKEKELFVRRKSEEKRLRIKYLQLKVKMKELKMALIKKKLSKL